MEQSCAVGRKRVGIEGAGYDRKVYRNRVTVYRAGTAVGRKAGDGDVNAVRTINSPVLRVCGYKGVRDCVTRGGRGCLITGQWSLLQNSSYLISGLMLGAVQSLAGLCSWTAVSQ